MDGKLRLLRRARGFAPAPMPLPPGFADAPEILALGAELKSTFCLVKHGEAILSQHQGDLQNAETYEDYCKNLRLYTSMFQHAPVAFAVDRHGDYLSSKLGARFAQEQDAPLIEIQHHHAHVAACLAENLRPLTAPKVLGIVLDGLGLGDDNQIWGGEFLLADYLGSERLATFRPVAMLGGDRASREPWRNLYAHLAADNELGAMAAGFRRPARSRRARRQAARHPRRHAEIRPQRAARLVLRPVVRRHGGGAGARLGGAVL